MAVFPDPSDVRAGVVYGPNDNDFTGTLGSGPINSPTSGTSPFAAVLASIRERLTLRLSISSMCVIPVANDRYKITIAELFFLYVRVYGITQSRDPGLEFTNAGAGRLSTPVARRIRIYVYTRHGEDSYGEDTVALMGQDPTTSVVTGSTSPGQMLAEELVFNALNNFLPQDSVGTPLTLTPLHPLDASEEPERPPEDEAGLLRSCLDFEAVYNLAVDPTDPQVV